jgi:hypothetical protein
MSSTSRSPFHSSSIRVGRDRTFMCACTRFTQFCRLSALQSAVPNTNNPTRRYRTARSAATSSNPPQAAILTTYNPRSTPLPICEFRSPYFLAICNIFSTTMDLQRRTMADHLSALFRCLSTKSNVPQIILCDLTRPNLYLESIPAYRKLP